MNRNPGRRPQRVAEAIRQAVAEFLTAEARDPRIGFVTVTHVKVTPDLKRAVVAVMVHGDEEEKKQCLYGLAQAEGAIRRTIHSIRIGRRKLAERRVHRGWQPSAASGRRLPGSPADAWPTGRGNRPGRRCISLWTIR